MTPFFRRIRQKLANENQFLKYSRYAVGEIVLVVIGILIALQINNWNEVKKARAVEINYLENLKADLVLEDKNIEGFSPCWLGCPRPSLIYFNNKGCFSMVIIFNKIYCDSS